MVSAEKNQALLIDASVEQTEVLLSGVNDAVRTPTQVAQDEDPAAGLQTLLNDPTMTCLHVLGHGRPGGVRIGSRWLTPEDFRVAPEVAAARSEHLEIYFWSCRTGAEARGKDFMQRISEHSMSHVFASTGLIGDENQGGSWKLDAVTKPRVGAPFSAEARDAFGLVLAPTVSATQEDGNLVFSLGTAISATLRFTLSDTASGAIGTDTAIDVKVSRTTTSDAWTVVSIDETDGSSSSITENELSLSGLGSDEIVVDRSVLVDGTSASVHTASDGATSSSSSAYTVDTSAPSGPDLAAGNSGDDSAVDFLDASEADGTNFQAIAANAQPVTATDIFEISFKQIGTFSHTDDFFVIGGTSYSTSGDFSVAAAQVGSVTGVDATYTKSTDTLVLSANDGLDFASGDVAEIVSGIGFQTTGAEGQREFEIAYRDEAGNSSATATQSLIYQEDISATVWIRDLGNNEEVTHLAYDTGTGLIRADSAIGVDITSSNGDSLKLDHFGSGNQTEDFTAELYFRVENDTGWDWVFSYEHDSNLLTDQLAKEQTSTGIQSVNEAGTNNIVDYVQFRGTAGQGEDSGSFVASGGEVVSGVVQVTETGGPSGGDVELDGDDTYLKFAAVKIDNVDSATNEITGSVFSYEDLEIEIFAGDPNAGGLSVYSDTVAVDGANGWNGGHGQWSLNVSDLTANANVTTDVDYYVSATVSADIGDPADGRTTQISGPVTLDVTAPDVDLVSGGGDDATNTGYVNNREANGQASAQPLLPDLDNPGIDDISQISIVFSGLKSADTIEFGSNVINATTTTDQSGGSIDVRGVSIDYSYDASSDTLDISKADGSAFSGTEINTIFGTNGIGFSQDNYNSTNDTVPDTTDGERQLSVTFTDRAGNVGASATQTLLVDRVNPTFTDTSDILIWGSANSQVVNLGSRVGDDNGLAGVSSSGIDGNSWSESNLPAGMTLSNSGDLTVTGSIDGPVSGDFTVSDKAGNSVTETLTISAGGYAVISSSNEVKAAFSTFAGASGGAASGDTIAVADDGDSSAETFSISGSENIDVDASLDRDGFTLTGNSGDNVITGGAGDDTIVGGSGSDTVNFTGNFDDYSFSYQSGDSELSIADEQAVRTDGTDVVSGVETLEFAATTAHVVGAGGYATVLEAVTAGGVVSGDQMLVTGAEFKPDLATADAIKGLNLQFNVPVTTLADTAANFSGTSTGQFGATNTPATTLSDAGYLGYTSLETTDSGEASIDAGVLAGREVTLTGNFKVIGTRAEIEAMSESVASGEATTLVLDDSSAVIAGLTIDEIARLRDDFGVDEIVGNGNIELTLAQMQAIDAGGINFTLSSGSVTRIGSSDDELAADGEALTALSFVDSGFAVATETNATTTAGATVDGQIIDGSGGRDDITGSANTDILKGGANSDTLTGTAGSDELIGGADSDRYVLNDNALNNVVIEASGGGDNDVIQTSLGDGTTAQFVLPNHVEILRYTSSNNFTGIGNSGDNFIYGNAGNDTLRGGSGDDHLFGGAGNDTLLGEAGNDTFIVGVDSRLVIGSVPDESAGSIDDYSGDTSVSGGSGIDTLQFQANESSTKLDLVLQSNTTGIERIVMANEDGQSSTQAMGVDARALSPNASWDVNSAPSVLSFDSELRSGDDMAGVTLDGVEIVGTDSANTINGSEQADIILGGKGADDKLAGHGGDDFIFGGVFDDKLFGGSGDDMLFGGSGNDEAEGGAGADVFFGGPGADIFRGGAGNDTVVLDGAKADYSISLSGNDRFAALNEVIIADGSGDSVEITDVETVNYGGNMVSGDLSGGESQDVTGDFRIFDTDGSTLLSTHADLTAALGNVSANQVIAIADGVTVSGDISIGSGDITLIGSGQPGSAAFSGTLTVTGDNVTLSGFEFTPVTSGDTSLVASGDGIVIDDNAFTGLGASTAIDITDANAGVEITDNTIGNGATAVIVASDYAGGASGDLVLTGNTITGATSEAIAIDGVSGDASFNISDNSFSGNAVSIEFSGSGTYSTSGDISIRENTFSIADTETGVTATNPLPAVYDSTLGKSLLVNSFNLTGSGDGTGVDIQQLDNTANQVVLTSGDGFDSSASSGGDVIRLGAENDNITIADGHTVIGGAGSDTVTLAEASGSYTVERVSTDGNDNGLSYFEGDFRVVATASHSSASSGDTVAVLRGVENVLGSGGGVIDNLSNFSGNNNAFIVTPGADPTQAFDTAVSGDSVTFGSGGNTDFVNAREVITSDTIGVGLAQAQNLTLTLSEALGVKAAVFTGTAGANVKLLGNNLGVVLDASAASGDGVTLQGGTGDDVFIGSQGDDTIILATGGGDDVIDGGSGSDTATFLSSGTSLDIDLSTGLQQNFDPDGSGPAPSGDYYIGNLGDRTLYFAADASGDATVENIVATNQSDSIVGDANDNDYSGAGGGDLIRGGDGNDTIDGGDGDDGQDGGGGLYGGVGNDTIIGGAGDDDLYGEAGNDTLNAGIGNNRVAGGAGDDTYTFDAPSGSDSQTKFVGGSGDDTVELSGTIDQYLINRFDSLAAVNLVEGGFSGSQSTPDLGPFDFDPAQPVFRIERVFDDGSRKTDLLQAENFVFDSGTAGSGDDVTFIWGTLDDLDTSIASFDQNSVDNSGVFASGGASDNTIFFTVEDGTTGFTYNGGGDPAALFDQNFVVGSSSNDVFIGGDSGDVFLDQGGDDVIRGGLGADTLDGGAGNDDYLITPEIYNGDEDNFLGEGFQSGDTITDSGASGTDRVFIEDGVGARDTSVGENSVDFTSGDLTGIEQVLYANRNNDGSADHSGQSRIVDVTSEQFDAVNEFIGSSGGSDRLEVNFGNNQDTDSAPIVDDIEDLVLDSSGDGSAGERNDFDAGSVTRDATIFVRGTSGDGDDHVRIDNGFSDVDAAGESFNDGYGSVYSGVLDVNLRAGLSGDVSIETGSNNTSVTTRTGTTASINADRMADSTTLNLDGADNIVVNKAGSITIDASNDLSGSGFDTDSDELLGTLVVNADASGDVTLFTGRGETTFNGDDGTADIDATKLADDTNLNLQGSSDVTVTGLQGDVVATTSSGVIDITTVNDGGDSAASGDDDISVTTGTDDMRIRGSEAGGTITVDANAMDAGDQLSVGQNSDFVISNVATNVTISGNGLDVNGDSDFNDVASGDVQILDGTMVVTTDDGATGVTVETGTDRTTVNTNTTGGSQNGEVTVDASLLASGDGDLTSGALLEVTGAARFDVTDLVGDLDATAMNGGPLNLETADAGDDGITIALGDANAAIETASGGTDTVTIDAAGMTDAGNDTLTLGGGANTVTVTDLVGSLDADGDDDINTSVGTAGFNGTLNVTTGALDQADGVTFVLGDGTTNITANQDPSGDTTPGQTDLTIDADALNTNDLNLSGDADIEVDDVSTNVTASGLTGRLDVDSDAQSTFTLTAGAGRTALTAGTGSTITVDAAALDQIGSVDASGDAELTLDGGDSSGSVTVNAIDSDIDASAFNGQLTINTAAIDGRNDNNELTPVMDIITGTFDTTINGDDAAVEKDNLDITVDASLLAGTNNTLTLEGDAEFEITNDTVDKTLIIDISSIGDNDELVLKGVGDFRLTGTQADIDASALSGDIRVETLSGDASTDINVTAGTGVTTVEAVESGDKITLDADNLVDDVVDVDNSSGGDVNEVVALGTGEIVVNNLAADLDASGLSGDLTVDVIDAATGQNEDVDIILGERGATITQASNVEQTYVDASNVGSGDRVELLGGENTSIKIDQVASGVIVDGRDDSGDATDSTYLGALDVTTVDNATDNIEVYTGALDSSVTSDGGTVDIFATDLESSGAEKTLTIAGTSDFNISEIGAFDIIAGSSTGAVSVTTDPIAGSGTSEAMKITAGTGTLTVSGDDSVDGNTTDEDIEIDANNLSDTNSDTDLILTGDAEYRIDSNANSGEVTIDASGLDASGGLTLSGTGDFNLVNTTQDVTAPNLTGTLTVTTKSGDGVNDINVQAGTGPLIVDVSDSGDKATVNLANQTDDFTTDDDFADAANNVSDTFEFKASGDGTVIAENVEVDVDGTALTGTLTVDVASGGSDVDIRTSSGNTIVNTNGVGASVDAAAMGTSSTLFLNESGDVGVFNVGDGATVDGASGDYAGVLQVKTDFSSGDSATVNTGVEATTVIGDSGSVTIDAQDLADTVGGADTTKLTLEGGNTYTVNNLQSDVDASSASGFIDITTIDDAGDSAASGEDSISITAGSGSANIRATENGSTVAVDATATGSSDVISVGGSGDFIFTGVGTSVDVRADGNTSGVTTLDGTLRITTEDGAANVDVFTGNSFTEIFTQQTGERSGNVRVHANELDDGDGSFSTGSYLVLDGAADVDVYNLASDVDASGSTGVLDIRTQDISGSGIIEVKLGSHRAGVNVASDAENDTINVYAGSISTVSANKNLILSEGHTSSKVVVNDLVTDLIADGSSSDTGQVRENFDGELIVNTGALDFNDGTTFRLGTGQTTLNTQEKNVASTAGAIDLTVDASALDSNKLTISGDADVEVTDVEAEVDASGSTGELTVRSDTSGATYTVTTGSDKTTIDSGTGGTVTVQAGNLVNDGSGGTSELLLEGAGRIDVNDIDADVDAAQLAGTLDLVAKTDAEIDIIAGTGTNNIKSVGASGDIDIDAAAGGSNTYNLYGSGSISVSNVSDGVFIDADGATATGGELLSGELFVDLVNGVSDVDIITGSTQTTIGGDASGGGAVDTDINAVSLADNQNLILTGATDFIVSNLKGDLVTTPANPVNGTTKATGTLTVTTANSDVDDAINIETSEGPTTVDTAGDDGDTVVINASPLANDTLLSVSGDDAITINNLAGDLYADNSTSGTALNVDLAAASDNDITLDIDRTATVNAFDIGNTTINVTGTDSVTINSGDTNVDASGVSGVNSDAEFTGELTINTVELAGDATSPAMVVTTGSNSTTINGLDSQEGVTNEADNIDIRVDATLLSDSDTSTTLSLLGNAEYELINNDTTSGDAVQVDLENSTNVGNIDLTGSGTFDLFNATTDINADIFDGDLIVTSSTGSDTFTITAGSSGDLTVNARESGDQITVNASAKIDDATDDEVGSGFSNASGDSYEFSAEGSGEIIFNSLGADLDASSHSGDLTVDLLSGATLANRANDDVDILTGTGITTIETGTGADAADVTIDASIMDGSATSRVQLTGEGSGDVYGLGDGVFLKADGLSGPAFSGVLNAYTKTLADSETVSISVGSGETFVSGDAVNAGAADVDINGSELNDVAGTELTVAGDARFEITALAADVDASAAAAAVDIATLNDAGTSGDAITVITGSEDTQIVGNGSGGFVEVDATSLTSGDGLSVYNEAEFVVNNVNSGVDVRGDLTSADPSGSILSGNLTVNLSSGASNVDVFAGSSSITAVSGDGGVTVEAGKMDRTSSTIQLSGSMAAIVGGLTNDVDAAALTGTLGINMANNQSDDSTITTGSGATTVNGESGDNADVLAGNISDDTLLSLTGDADYVVTSLVGDLDISSGSGTASVQLDNVASGSSGDITVTADRTTTIDAGAMGAEDTLNLSGDGDITVTRSTNTNGVSGDGIQAGTINLNGSTGAIEINTAPIAGSGSVVTGLTGANSSQTIASGDLTELETQAAMKIIAGSGDLTVSGDDSVSGDSDIVDIFIDDSNMAIDDILTLKGDAEYFINGLTATLRASTESDPNSTFELDPRTAARPSDDADTAEFPLNTGGVYPPDADGIDSNLVSQATGDMVILGADAVDNLITAGGGDDRIDGGTGDDYIRGADGNDLLIGGSGDDSLFGGDGDDILYGGSGPDGNDFISGGDDFDTAVFEYTDIVDGVYELTVGGNTFSYSFERSTDVNTGGQVEVIVRLSDGTNTFTDKVLRDVENFLFVSGDEALDPNKGVSPEDLIGPVINLDTDVRFQNIQLAVDAASSGDQILLTPNNYQEEAFITKDLDFFVQNGADGVTLTLDRDANGSNVANIDVLSATDLSVNGNEGANRINVLDAADFTGNTSGDAVFLDGTLDGSGDISFGQYGVMDDFDLGNYTFDGRGGDDELIINPLSEKIHYLFGGSGNDHLAGGQAPTWLQGGSGNDTLYSVGGSDRLLGGSGNDEIILGTYNDDTQYLEWNQSGSGDGSTVIFLGAGDDVIVPASLDETSSGGGNLGIDIDALVADYTRGEDRIDLGFLRNTDGSQVDLTTLINDADTTGSNIDLDDYLANVVASDVVANEQNVDAEGSIKLLGVNVGRLVNADLAAGGDIGWKDEFETLFGASPLV